MVYYNRLNQRSNRVPSGFTSSDTVTTTQAKIRTDVALRAGLTVNGSASDMASVPTMPGAGG